ncbi:hypothetical protein [Bartonella apis]|uniref:hypothetical protein n=1 Tax=Bartonella apis TaxID=1686310 RepID=UPI003BB798EB
MQNSSYKQDRDEGVVLRKQAVIAFLIFTVVGGFGLCVCRCMTNYFLYSRFFNDRFILDMMENFSSIAAILFYLAENLLEAAVFSIFPTVYLYQLKRLPIVFVMSYSGAIYLMGAIGVAFYLNLARVTLPLNSILVYVLLTPFLYIIVPIWVAYMVYYIYWLAHAEMKT